MWPISTNIPINLANFLDTIIPFFLKNIGHDYGNTNHSTPEPVRVNNMSSTQLPTQPPAAGTKVPKPARASKSLPEIPALAPTADPIAAELAGGQERLTQLSPTPLATVQPTSPDSIPGPSSAAKKPSRLSNKSLGFIASTYVQQD
jgi:hypothetical protein